MRRGLRLTTGAELARLDSPPTPVQLGRAQACAQQLLDLGPAVDATPWLGNRPCMVDMLPAIGPVARQRGLWFNFGHGHQGFTLGPVSGRLLAEQITGQPTVVDPTPYLPARFGV
jgi:D-amino-acid dehydrogenase